MSNERKKLYRFILMGLIVLFLFLMLIMNQLVARLFVGQEEFVVQSLTPYVASHGKAYYATETIYLNNNTLRNLVTINGWALASCEKDNPNRKVNIFLISSSNSYSIESDLVNRPELYNVYADKLGGSNTFMGYTSTFSPIAMKDGIYNIYLNIVENDEEYALVRTSTYLLKKDGEISREIELNNTHLKIDEDIYYDRFTRYGTIYADNYSSIAQYYVEDHLYNNIQTQLVEEVEKIPDSTIDSSSNSGVLFYLQKQEKYNLLRLFQRKAQPQVRYDFEKFALEDGILSIRGWCLYDGMNCDDQKVYLQLKSKDGQIMNYQFQSHYRLDVAEYLYNNYGGDFDKRLNSGISMDLNLAKYNVDPGEYTIQLLFNIDQDTSESKIVRLYDSYNLTVKDSDLLTHSPKSPQGDWID